MAYDIYEMNYDGEEAEENPVLDNIWTIAAALAIAGGAYWWWSNQQSAEVEVEEVDAPVPVEALPVEAMPVEATSEEAEGLVEEEIMPTDADLAPLPLPKVKNIVTAEGKVVPVTVGRKPRIRRVLARTLFVTMKIPKQVFRFKKVGENKTTGAKLITVRLPKHVGGPKLYNFEVSADHRTAKKLFSK